MRPATPQDRGLRAVASALGQLDPDGSRTACVLRSTFDQLYDGARTGRYNWDQLYSTERRGGGNIVEINLQREFKFQDGITLDYLIAGTDVDCKYSQTCYAWMIPPEAVGHLCLVMWAEDTKDPKWSMGLVRATTGHLHTAGNRDAKCTLNQDGRKAVFWLFDRVPLPPNVFLQLDPQQADRILALPSGVKRVNELFRVAQRMRVGRAAVATAGEQVDYMKRVRYNGGARSFLQPEGIIILGQYSSHVKVALDLGLPVPVNGESVSARVVPVKGPARAGVTRIQGTFWRLAAPDDPVTPAPIVPEI